MAETMEVKEEIKMKTKISLIFGITLALLLIGFASASVNVTYNFYRDTINADGTTTYTNTQVSGVNVIGFICSSANCASVSSVFLPEKTVSGNSVTITYPTNLQSSYGYGIYFYKEGYIDWEVNATWAGNGVVSAPRNVYLAKKEKCYAPINNLSVLRQVEAYKLIEIEVPVDIDSDTYAAIRNAGPLNYNPTQLEIFRKVDTQVTLQIKNAAGNVIKTETKTVSIPYSGKTSVKFNYTFENVGRYDLSVSTNVVDQKCLNSVEQKALANLEVIPANLKDYSYSMINNLVYTPDNVVANTSLNVSFNALSYYLASDGVQLTRLPTAINVQIYKDASLTETFNYNLSSSDYSSSFVRVIGNPGNYRILVKAMPAEARGNPVIGASQEVSFTVGNPVPPTPENDTIAPTINVNSPLANQNYNYSRILVSITASDNVNLDKIWYEYNGNMAYYSSPVYVNFPANATINLTVFANDTSGNVAVKTLSFTTFQNSTNPPIPPTPENNTLSITGIITNPTMPFINNGSSQTIGVSFLANHYPLRVTFSLYNNTSLVDSQGSFLIANASDLPARYYIPATLVDGLYSLTMKVEDNYNNSLTFNLGSFTVKQISDKDDDDEEEEEEDLDDDEEDIDNFKEDCYEVEFESGPLILGNQTSITAQTKNSEDSTNWMYYLVFTGLGILILLVLIAIAKRL